MENVQPIVPEGTPLPTPPVGVPPYPITPFAVWTWSTPVIPEFYWNVYSSEQRIKSICKEIGRIEAYLNYLVNETNKNIIEIHDLITKLTDRVAALEEKLKEEVARLDALIAKLREDLEKEIADREAADEALGERIDQEVIDRTHGDQTLHQEIADEATARTHADDALHSEISTETQDRIHADDALHEEISHRLLPTDVQAGDEIEITRPDPESNTIVIASTVAHSIAELASTVSGLQAALTAETAERRADDSKLWQAVNQRIERGKILAGPGIRVENDPDASTVTISATGGGTGGTTIEAGEGIKVATEGDTATVSLATPYPTVQGTAPVTVQATSSTTPGAPGTGTTYAVSVSAATESKAGIISEARVKELAGSSITINGENPIYITEKTPGIFNVSLRTEEPLALDDQGNLKINPATSSQAGIISEARVKELAGSVAPSVSAEAPLKIEDGTISLTKDPAGPVTSSSAGLSVREITPETESESEAGVVSKETIKSLAASGGAYPGVSSTGGLEARPDLGGLRVKGIRNFYNPIDVTSEGDLALTGGGEKLVLDNKEITLTEESDNEFFTAFSGRFIRDISTVNNDRRAVFVLPDGFFEVKKNGSASWEKARVGCFELFAEADRLSNYSGNAGYPIYHTLYVRLTPRGQAFYTNQAPTDSGKTQITALRVTYSVYDLYIWPEAA